MKDTVGTVYTMAPELLAGNYNEKADIWSLGVMAFMLLSSSMPFYGKDRSEVIKRICRGKIHFKAKGWNNKSDVCKHLVLTLLNKHVDERPTSEEALNMIKEWRDSCEEARDVSNSEPPLQISNDSSGVKSNYYHGASERSCNTADTGTSSHMSNSSASYNSSSKHYNKSHAAHNMLRIQASIHAFAQYNMLKKLALMIIAYKSTSSEIGFLRHMFQTYFDVYQNGQICLEEFATALQPFFNYTPDEVEALFQGMDVDGSGIVHYTEFLAATIESHGSISEDRLADAFDRMDCDDSGYITLENLRDFLGDDVPLEYLETIVKEADILKDKRINYEEFLQLWNVGCDQVLDDAKDDVLKRQKQAGSYARNFQWSSSSRVEESSNENYVVALKDDSVVQEQSTGQRQQQQLPDCMKTPTINNISSQVDAVQCFKKQKALSVRNSW